MKVTLKWLRQYAAFDWDADELARRLTMLGLEVEGIERVGGEFAGVVVAQVLTRDRHPNADKLSVCRVSDGHGQREIVCGADNYKAGDKVVLILPGNALPLPPGEKEPRVIKEGKIRGVTSQGMLCSAEELGLDPESLGLPREEGILVLDPGAPVGQSFAEFLGRGDSDVVYDLEVTPNRPDLNSVIGIAREIAAVTGNALRLPAVSLPPAAADGAKASELIAVRLEAPDLCPRYTARVLSGVAIGPSPAGLRSMLERVGLRSINNVVDVTNYVMLETGQPLHAFDYRLVEGAAGGCPTIVVRRAADGERFVTLDGKEHLLTRDHLLIADELKGIALAGVMGGRNTEVHSGTTDILLESAWFEPTNIRRTSKTLGLRTDASYRFERGTDPMAADWASARAAALILASAGGALAEGVVDAWPEPFRPRHVTLRHARVNELLGLSLKPEEIEYYLGQLGLRKVSRRARPVDAAKGPEPVTFEIPSFRVDVKREVDLIEEVARFHGVDKIPSTEPRQALGTHPFDGRYDAILEARHLLAGLGLSEAQGQTLISRSAANGVPSEELVLLENPLSSDMDALRPSLIPGLLGVLRHNVRHQTHDVALFEIGRVFRRGQDGVAEGWRVAIALTGAREQSFWSGAERGSRFDAYDLKGIIEDFFEHLGLRGAVFSRCADTTEIFVESATLTLGGRIALGEMGQIQPRLARDHDLRDPVLVAELDLEQILARRNTSRSFKPLPAFPSVRRDVAMVVPEEVTHDAVLRTVREAKPSNLDTVVLFDVFRGRHVTEGHKSVAYAFTYRAPDRTLTDAEVNAAHERVLAHLRQSLGATVRE
jgi:phenylalanyl-tRNA synthetase beta chain